MKRQENSVSRAQKSKPSPPKARRTLKNLAAIISAEFSDLRAEIDTGSYCIEREWKGHRAVLSRRYVHKPRLRVYHELDRMRPIYALDTSAWYSKVRHGYEWLENERARRKATERRPTKRQTKATAPPPAQKGK